MKANRTQKPPSFLFMPRYMTARNTLEEKRYLSSSIYFSSHDWSVCLPVIYTGVRVCLCFLGSRPRQESKSQPSRDRRNSVLFSTPDPVELFFMYLQTVELGLTLLFTPASVAYFMIFCNPSCLELGNGWTVDFPDRRVQLLSLGKPNTFIFVFGCSLILYKEDLCKVILWLDLRKDV